eukprot:6176363-Prymnesium_polylepis.1
MLERGAPLRAAKSAAIVFVYMQVKRVFISVTVGDLMLINTSIGNSSAFYEGGALAISNGRVTMKSTSIISSRASGSSDSKGGAIILYSGTLTVTDRSSIIGSLASHRGGLLYVERGEGSAHFYNTTILDSTTTRGKGNT